MPRRLTVRLSLRCDLGQRGAMRSMTGFGSGQAPLGAGRVLLEARSLNHRHVEVRVMMPPEIAQHGFFVEQRLRERARRGRYSVVARLEAGPAPVALDEVRARAAYAALSRLRDELDPGQPLPLSLLAAVPDLFRPADLAPNEVQRALGAALDAALAELDAMRAHEGLALAAALRVEIAGAAACRRDIAALHAAARDAFRARLRERVERLVRETSAQPDVSRLEAEIALLAERGDVTEELARLDSHLAQLERLFEVDEPVGRRIDFLLQELGREANTIASKSQDAGLSQRVVDLKASLERLREQAQNVE